MAKKIIGYTTGAFDLFHIGHLNLLRKCKLNCDYLIVGVSTDELIESYKNNKPSITLNDRVEILKSIRYVDKVVVQYDRNKLEAAKKFKCDVMFVGSDWKGSEIFTKLEVELKKIKVDLKFFEYTKRISTTQIKKDIKK